MVEQRVTRQYGDVLAVADVRRRATAAQRVVVQRGQVVVDEEKVCTSSIASAVGSASQAAQPNPSAVARQSTGRTRLPPASSE